MTAVQALDADRPNPNRSGVTPGELPKTPTGISGLDDLTGGGVPRVRSTLVCGPAGCGKTLLAMEFLVRGIIRFDEPGVAFEDEADIVRRLLSHGSTNVEDRAGTSATSANKLADGPRHRHVVNADRTDDAEGDRPANWWYPPVYVAGPSPKSMRAFASRKGSVRGAPAGQYEIGAIDLIENPSLARGDAIFAVPTPVRRRPPPLRKVIGDFSNPERVLLGLRFAPEPTP